MIAYTTKNFGDNTNRTAMTLVPPRVSLDQKGMSSGVSIQKVSSSAISCPRDSLAMAMDEMLTRVIYGSPIEKQASSDASRAGKVEAIEIRS